jgi:hypothetical protein
MEINFKNITVLNQNLLKKFQMRLHWFQRTVTIFLKKKVAK